MFIKSIVKLVAILFSLFFLFSLSVFAVPPYLEIIDQAYDGGNIPIPPAAGSTAVVQKIHLADDEVTGTPIHITHFDVEFLNTADAGDIASIRFYNTDCTFDTGFVGVSSFPVAVAFVIPDGGEDTLWVEVRVSANATHGAVLKLKTWIQYWEDWEDNTIWDYAVDSAPETLGEGPAPTAAVFRVTSEGDVLADGAYYGQEFYTGAADVAEWVPVSEPVAPGDVLELDPENPGYYRKARGRCSTLVSGVVSTDPGFILGANPSTLDFGPWTDDSRLPTDDSRPWTSDSALLALIGIVPVKVTDEGGPIRPGDLLVVSSTLGYAMRWNPSDGVPCGLVGKALEPLTDASGVILVLLMAH